MFNRTIPQVPRLHGIVAKAAPGPRNGPSASESRSPVRPSRTRAPESAGRPAVRPKSSDEAPGPSPRAEKTAASGAAPAAPRAPPKPKTNKVKLDETSPLYQPVLDSTQLQSEPPGHRSGYVAIVGRPNAGKSTFLNAVLGQKLSIVTPKAQTTRHKILAILSDTEYQVVFLDTPGVIAKQMSKLEERMMRAVKTAIKDADCLLAIIDASDRPDEALMMLQPGEGADVPPMGVILNKMDLLDPEQQNEVLDYFRKNCRADAIFTTSAAKAEGLEEVKEWVVGQMPVAPSLYPKDIVAEQTERFFVAELIREKIFNLYAQEVPYGCQVEIADFKERRPPAKDYILAEVWVEKEGHRKMIIGKEGAALKRLSMESRKSVEGFLEREVFLEIAVKVKKDWRDDADLLPTLGY